MKTAKRSAIWHDIVNPSDKDIERLKKTYRVHPVILNELRKPSIRTHVEQYDGYMYLVYHFPIFDAAKKVSRRAEIDFLITKDEVITVHYQELGPLNDFKRSLENEDVRSKALEDTLQLTYHIIQELLSFQERQLNHIQEKIEKIGLQLFKDKEKQVLEQISYLKPDISEYRIITRPQDHLLRSLLESGEVLWGKSSRAYLNDLIGQHLKVTSQIEDYHEALDDFEDTNNQLMSYKTTQVMKTFTILAFLTFPMMLIATLFSMNAKDTPIVGLPGDFWIIFSIMAIGMIGMYTYFKRKDWL